MKEFVIGANDAGQRLDKFLQKAAPLLPASLMYKSIRKKNIKLDGGRCAPSDMLREGQVLRLYLNDEFFATRDRPFLAAPAEVRVVYEDENILLADKPPGLLVHDDASGTQDTLIHRVQHYLFKTGAWDPGVESSFTPALCNRIDRNTGGIVMAAKNFASLQILTDKIKQREVSKLYLCVVHGTLRKRSGLLKGYHVKDSATNAVRITREPRPGAKTALTKYRVLAEKDGMSLLEVELLTGRTHQIRAQFAAIGHPLEGDAKYGAPRGGEGDWQSLYSYRLRFAFVSDAGRLNGLKDKTFTVENVPFAAPFGVRIARD